MRTIGFLARAILAVHGIMRLHRVATDNGANFRAADFTRTIEALARRHLSLEETARRRFTGQGQGVGEVPHGNDGRWLVEWRGVPVLR